MPNIVEVVSVAVGTLGNIETIKDIVGGCYKEFTNKRLEIFAKDCEECLFEGSKFDEVQFKNLFSSENSVEHIHRFFHSILGSYSRVAQLAIAKLYCEVSSRGTKNLYQGEIIILKMLQNLEDHDVEVLFKCFDVAYKTQEGNLFYNNYKDATTKFIFQFGTDDFEENKATFVELGIIEKGQLKRSLQYFIGTKVFTERTNIITSGRCDLWLCDCDETTKKFLELLEWAKNKV